MENFKDSYSIASIGEKEKETIKKCEEIMKEETGKNFVMIAWEKATK